ncbi:BrnT family toxin [Amaricoccus sp.]|uniref:BrnT family toxin n=1 Tax=Amaricoccus sp. TaxID=1872485 RepID=UPI001B3F1733|nr:BrnT family toxin [Amaricoccus sp.]MBP7002093.1 BrnT family toxin [Amaricoccus sp.]
MLVEFDPVKRQATLDERGLDMAEAGLVFAGDVITVEDDRRDDGEPRYVTVGRLRGRIVFVAWTPRGDARRIIRMRKANDRERAIYGGRV